MKDDLKVNGKWFACSSANAEDMTDDKYEICPHCGQVIYDEDEEDELF